jgi:cytochrome c-type biogenesis protein CcmH
MKALTTFLTVVLIASAAWAVQPNERLTNPALEQRARDVSKALRCVVCQNETIDESNAELARDMRVLVRERIAAGDSNEQVLSYMVQRYGDFVLLKPRFTAENLVLWLGPFVLLVIGGFVVARRLRRPPVASAPALNDNEMQELAALRDQDRKP